MIAPTSPVKDINVLAPGKNINPTSVKPGVKFSHSPPGPNTLLTVKYTTTIDAMYIINNNIIIPNFFDNFFFCGRGGVFF